MVLLKGKTAVITGGTTGIGLATAKRFVEEGAYVFISGRRQAELDAAVKELGENATGVQGDVGKAEDLDRLYAAVADSGRRLDVVFANAAVVDVARIGDITEDSLKDRRILGEEGFISVIVVIDSQTGKVVSGPIGQRIQFAPRSLETSNPFSVAAYQRLELKAMSCTTCWRGCGLCATALRADRLELPARLDSGKEVGRTAFPVTWPARFQDFCCES